MKEGDTLPKHLNYMKSRMSQLATIRAPIDNEDAIAVLFKSMPLEQYGHLVSTLQNLPDPTLDGIAASLLEEYKKKEANHNGTYNGAF